jgi:hypothetical protein
LNHRIAILSVKGGISRNAWIIRTLIRESGVKNVQ